MASTKTRLRSIRKRASKHTNPKDNTIVIDGDDFWWIMKLIYVDSKFDLLEKNQALQNRIVDLEKTLEENK